ncbi:MAG TPA: MaoC family dehydratase [Candidatus Elarobacter sp.]|jgi:acyl dehydratase|nr:MaoC family dehydratase [Candidatus Elarobacter sp.]
MQPTEFSSVDDLVHARGRRIGESAWTRVTQPMVDAFADVTGDRQWIHVDPERARRESPMGGPVAHGFLTVSLLPSFIAQCVRFRNARLSLNYGFDRLRFVAPVPVGAEIRGAFALEDVRAVDGGAQLTWRVEVEVRGSDKPAVAALWLTRVLFAESPAEV